MLDKNHASSIQAMVGFRNVAVHDCRKLNLDIRRVLLDKHLDEFRELVGSILKRSNGKVKSTLAFIITSKLKVDGRLYFG